ncbi:MAG: hypothetical protein HZC14_00920 [Candidatus Niyogibacteria bacterium]|nr:hypothetical protein [Candidatus Niyogibacteria bacterium]
MGSAERAFERPETIAEEAEKIEPKYHFEAIKQLEWPATSLVDQLKDKIDNDEYDILIGDDASGRVPTLILRSVINERKHQSHADKPPKENEISTKFIAGGRIFTVENDAAVSDFFKQIRPQTKKKALLVTEYMAAGKGVDRLARILNEVGMDFDVAAFSSTSSFEYYKLHRANLKDHELFIGVDSVDPPLIYAQSSLSGVTKKTKLTGYDPVMYMSAHAKPEKKSKDRSRIDRLRQQKFINQVREDIKILADEVVKKVWG